MTGGVDLAGLSPAALLGFEPEGVSLVGVTVQALCEPAKRRGLLAAAKAAVKAGVPLAVDLDRGPGDGVERTELRDWLRAILGPGSLAVARPASATLFPGFFDPEACLEGLLELGAEAAVVAPAGGKVLAGTAERVLKKGPTPAFLDQNPGARRAFYERLAAAWGPSLDLSHSVQKALAGT